MDERTEPYLIGGMSPSVFASELRAAWEKLTDDERKRASEILRSAARSENPKKDAKK